MKTWDQQTPSVDSKISEQKMKTYDPWIWNPNFQKRPSEMNTWCSRCNIENPKMNGIKWTSRVKRCSPHVPQKKRKWNPCASYASWWAQDCVFLSFCDAFLAVFVFLGISGALVLNIAISPRSLSKYGLGVALRLVTRFSAPKPGWNPRGLGPSGQKLKT